MSLTSCSCAPPTLARISSSWEEGYGHSHLPEFVVGGGDAQHAAFHDGARADVKLASRGRHDGELPPSSCRSCSAKECRLPTKGGRLCCFGPTVDLNPSGVEQATRVGRGSRHVPLVALCLGRRLSRQLQNGCRLTLAQKRQQHGAPIWKFERVVV